ncbi:hypothetical protein PJI16_15260 [Nitrospira sp. MA-1]|nr:hypothetical protein [Nitrospira sp. MA-1]
MPPHMKQPLFLIFTLPNGASLALLNILNCDIIVACHLPQHRYFFPTNIRILIIVPSRFRLDLAR